MSQCRCRDFRATLARAPLPMAHRLVQFLERQRDGVSQFAADKETRILVSAAGWTPGLVSRVIEAYRRQPVTIQRALAGSTYETPLVEGSLAQHALAWDYDFRYAVRKLAS